MSLLRRLDPRARARSTGVVLGDLDQPTQREVWPAPATRFAGWALDGGRLPAGVEIVLDGSKRFPAVLGLPRPDVAIALEQPGAANDCGWSAEIDLSAWSGLELTVKVVVNRGRRRRTTVAERVYELRADGFAGNVDAPLDGAEVVDNLLVVSGWAVFGQTGPARVEIEVDGRPYGRARLRLPNGAAQAADPARIGPAAGFHYAEVLPPEAGEEVNVAVLSTALNGRVVRMAERRVRHRPSAVPVVDVQRGATLRARTAASLPPSHASSRVNPGRPRLLTFTHQLSLGGGQLYLQELLRHVLPGLRSCTVVSPSDGVLRHELEDWGVDVVVTGQSAPNTLESYEGQVRELSMLIRGSGCDVVLVNTLAELPAADAAQRVGVSVIWAVHESYEIEAWLTVFYGERAWHPYIADRLRQALGGATRVIFEAQSTSDLFARYTEPARQLVIPYGIDIDHINRFAAGFDRTKARLDHDVPAEAVVFLVVGQVEERKSQIAIVEAFEAVALEHGNAVLVMVGDFPGLYSAALRSQMHASGLGSRIRLLPPTSEILEWYALADVLVSASDIESLPRSMMEAMALGVPVLSADVHGISELVSDGESGWLFAPRDMPALIDAMRKVISLGDQARRAAGQAARWTAVHRYDSSNYGQTYLELINMLTLATSEAPADSSETRPGAQQSRLDRALAVLDRAGHDSMRLGLPSRQDEHQLSMRLRDFNLEAPFTRDGIADFVAAVAKGMPPGARVVDVGAGDAPYRELFVHVDYVTIDWEHSIHGDPSQSDILASAEHLPLEDASIDAVLLTEVLEHLGSPQSALAEIARILRPSGGLYLTVPFVWILHEMPFDYFRYTPSALLMLLEQAGFEDITITPRGDYFTTIAQLLQIIPSWIGLRKVPDALTARRSQAAEAMARLSIAIADLSPLDDGALLPLGYNVKARRKPASAGGLPLHASAE